MKMNVYNVYYKGGYVGYVLVPEDGMINKLQIIQWLASKFNRSAGKGIWNEDNYETIKSNLTIEPKKDNVHHMFFKRLVFNDQHMLGDEFSFASV